MHFGAISCDAGELYPNGCIIMVCSFAWRHKCSSVLSILATVMNVKYECRICASHIKVERNDTVLVNEPYEHYSSLMFWVSVCIRVGGVSNCVMLYSGCLL